MAGDEALIPKSRHYYQDGDVENERVDTGADLYRRGADGKWVFVRELITASHPWWNNRVDVSMSATVATVQLESGLHIFERTASGWVEGVLDIPRPTGWDAEVFGNRIVAHASAPCAQEALVLERGTNGHWSEAGRIAIPAGSCLSSLRGDGNAIAALVRPPGPNPYDYTYPRSLRIFERGGGAWTLEATFVASEDDEIYGPALDIRNGLIVVSGTEQGAFVYRRGAAGWAAAGLLPVPGVPTGAHYSPAITLTDDYVLMTAADDPASVAYLFRRAEDGTFENVAKFAGRYGLSYATMDGGQVLAADQDYNWAFDVPGGTAMPRLWQDDFESASGPWQILPGSQFSIVQKGVTRAWRQSSLAGDAGALYDLDLTEQTVTADITPTAFNGADRWVGLVTRYTDEQNYYYVTLRTGAGGNRIALRRMQNGVWSDIGTSLSNEAFTLNAGQRYRVTLQSLGQFHQVLIDGTPRMLAYDSAHAHGKAGVRMYKASADIDNVIVSRGPVLQLSRFGGVHDVDAYWYVSGSSPRAQQFALPPGNARLVYGPAVEDSLASATVYVYEFGATGSPWVGLMARYVDENNYYYVTLRKSNELSLRKLTDGAITTLGTVILPVTTQTEYRLGLDVVGDRLRVWVNDEIRIERTGAEVRAGRVGLMTYRARALVRTYEPFSP